MADEVSRALMLDKLLLDGKSVLIAQYTDTSPFIHTFLAHSAKNGRKICLLTFNLTATHYHNIGTRLGWNSQLLQNKEQFRVIEGLLGISQELNSASDGNLFDFILNEKQYPLLNLFHRVEKILTGWPDSPVTLIIDRLDCLLSLGISTKDILQFYQQCHNLVKGTSSMHGAFVTSIELASDDKVLVHCTNLLSHWCDLVLTVKGLETGVSKDLTGSVSIQWAGNQQLKAYFHFKCFDRGVRMFSPGLAIL